MGFIAKVKFTTNVDGKEVIFRKGDKIPTALAKELNLEQKPNQATMDKPTK